MKPYNTILTKHSKLMYLTIITFGIIYITIDICNHYFFRTAAWDYGAYNFAFYDYSHFQIRTCPVYIGSSKSFMQDHLSFTMFIFIPFYWLFSCITGTYTLLILQTICILFGGWAVYKIIELKTSDKYFPLLGLLQYFTLYGRWSSFVSDCNLAIIASSIVPVFIYYFEKKKFLYASISFVFILLTREDMALWTLFIGIFLLISHFPNKQYRLASIIIIITSIIYFIIAFKILIPFFENPIDKFSLFNYSALGKTPTEAFIFILKHPWKTFLMLFINQGGDHNNDYVKFEFYYVYIISGGFLLFFRPKYLILFIPLLAKKMLNDDSVRWSVQLYYSIEFISIIPIAVFLILSEFKNKKLKYFLTILVCILSISITLVKIIGNNKKLDWWGDTKYAFYKSSMYKSPLNVKKIYKELECIPNNSKVSYSSTILPHYAFRKKPYYFPWVEDSEYIAVFSTDTYPLNTEQFNNLINKYRNEGKWITLVDDPPLLILKKKDNIN